MKIQRVRPILVPSPTVQQAPWSPGFSLIITITILVLLALVAVGLLTLSTITVRASNLSAAQSEAKANARLALMLAIGELQKQVGSDQRITATAGILDNQRDSPEIDGVAHPHWTGVWNSWAAGSQTFGGDERSKHSTIARPPSGNRRVPGMHPSYVDSREDHFRDWLVSLPHPRPEGRSERLDQARSFPLDDVLSPGDRADAVRLVGEQTLGTQDQTNYVGAALLDVDSDARPNTERNGRYAWWVADESTKARILADSYDLEGTPSNADYVARAQSSASTGHQIMASLATLNDPAQLQRAVSRSSLELAAGGNRTVRGAFHDSTPFSRGVLADVREGGLKRDLNALLERPINLADNRDSWMLYRFGRGTDRVPIQDLAAYYQCYREVVAWDGRQARNPRAGRSVQLNNIDFGTGLPSNSNIGFKRHSSHLYRFPVPIKLQYVLSYVARNRTVSDNDPNKDPYKLHIGITPAVTLWNPYNLPLVLNHGESRSTEIRYFNLPFGIRWTKTGTKGPYQSTDATSLSWITNRDHHRWGTNQNGNNRLNSDRYTGFEIFYAGKNPIVFEPGEVKVFSLNKSSEFNSGSNYIDTTTVYREIREVDPGWNPDIYIEMPRSDRNINAMHVEEEASGHGNDATKGGGALTFAPGDRISFTVGTADHVDLANGCAFQFFCRQSSVVQLINGNEDQTEDQRWLRRLYTFISRHHRGEDKEAGRAFARELMLKGFPDGESQIEFPPVRGAEIAGGEHRPFLLVSLSMASEVSSEFSGDARGRRFVQRPFLHSPPVQAMAFVDRPDHDSFYFQPWNWWVQGINSVLEASVQVDANNVNSFYGGGYTPEFGNTHCVQMEVPVAPLHSIGALSHAKLGGYSLADNMLHAGSSRRDADYAAVTATGANGLFPNVCQAIGNSYAHPYLQPDQVVSSWDRYFSAHTGKEQVPLVDHSYLANKALWDDYFFSSIAPHDRGASKLFETSESRTARQLATEAFFGGENLPNRRLVPHTKNLTEDRLDEYFDGNAVNLKGADELAGHLMVQGPFNVNSTSVDAWKALLCSLKDKSVASLHLDDSFARRFTLSKARSEGAPIGSTLLPNGDPTEGSPSEPSEARQWYAWRSLTDDEIEDLAEAIVRQVKQRGPFLSLSEFVNRRLDPGDRDLALKGALQAAIDDESIPDKSAINAGFRSAERRFTTKEIGRMNPKFKEALEGPVAYGSTAYIDQADILRHLGAQLTVRGDTFLIRTYGDSLDATGTVQARAWCEAVVQRVPEYLDLSADPAHAPYDDLSSEGNKSFGRPLRVVGFRWLAADEI